MSLEKVTTISEELPLRAQTALQETIDWLSVGIDESEIPSVRDYLSDEHRKSLFFEGYVYVGNFNPDVIKNILAEKISTDEEKFYAKSWFFQSGTSHRIATAYEYGNPGTTRTIAEKVALFIKREDIVNEYENVVKNNVGEVITAS